ncbi:aspartyl-phosphate phosphatase Spo0E family protein [Clostridium puniceum]|uniref:aspartyl-phosphate phosphatase Spo0E family protein n=1 Tax=Clostridium puniceum TaxID=29367 RepID=UPI00098BE5D6|nr:aspartyl-phosphate phosphatase Spo0E family protein [Clostridium puniceum]
MRELKLKNDEAISKFNQAMEIARANLHKAIEIYGRSSNEVIIASRNLDTYINMSMKREV